MSTLLHTFLLVAVSAIAGAQTLPGSWTGALEIQERQLRIVIHIQEENDTSKATPDSPDQNATGMLRTG